jgi:hypothetical protein
MQARTKNPAMVLPDAMDAIQSLYRAMSKGGVGNRHSSSCTGQPGSGGPEQSNMSGPRSRLQLGHGASPTVFHAGYQGNGDGKAGCECQ